jgi:bromodomain adjacent to zinc finger domain protein 1A
MSMAQSRLSNSRFRAGHVHQTNYRYYAHVREVHPPRRPLKDARSVDSQASSSTLPASNGFGTPDDDNLHKLGGDLKIPAKDAVAQDDPALYTYRVQLMELEKERSHEKGKAAVKALIQTGEALTGSYMDVECSVMRSDHISNLYLTN